MYKSEALYRGYRQICIAVKYKNSVFLMQTNQDLSLHCNVYKPLAPVK